MLWHGWLEVPPLWAGVALGAVFVLLMVLAELGRPVWCLTWTVAAFAFVHLCGLWDITEPIPVPAWQMFVVIGLGGLVSYLWSRYRWGVFLKRWRRSQDELVSEFKAEFLRRRGRPTNQDIPADLQQEWSQESVREPALTEAHFAPQFRHHWRRITTWAIFWPFSLTGFFIAGLCYPAVKFVLERIFRRSFQDMADREYEALRRNLHGDAAPPQRPDEGQGER
jgi:hypothetical protein